MGRKLKTILCSYSVEERKLLSYVTQKESHGFPHALLCPQESHTSQKMWILFPTAGKLNHQQWSKCIVYIHIWNTTYVLFQSWSIYWRQKKTFQLFLFILSVFISCCATFWWCWIAQKSPNEFYWWNTRLSLLWKEHLDIFSLQALLSRFLFRDVGLLGVKDNW